MQHQSTWSTTEQPKVVYLFKCVLDDPSMLYGDCNVIDRNYGRKQSRIITLLHSEHLQLGASHRT